MVPSNAVSRQRSDCRPTKAPEETLAYSQKTFFFKKASSLPEERMSLPSFTDEIFPKEELGRIY
jgi:hypothetical protein